MSEKLGLTKSAALLLCHPLPNGTWAAQPGTLHIVDGRVHKLVTPGLEVRSGEAFGLTATFHVVEELAGEAGGRTGTVVKWWVENGNLVRTAVVAHGVTLLE